MMDQLRDMCITGAECLKTLGHADRLLIVAILVDRPRTVGELIEACALPQSTMSTHLRVLRDRGLLRADRRGREVVYEVAEPHLASIIACIRARFGACGGRRPQEEP